MPAIWWNSPTWARSAGSPERLLPPVLWRQRQQLLQLQLGVILYTPCLERGLLSRQHRGDHDQPSLLVRCAAAWVRFEIHRARQVATLPSAIAGPRVL